jgi:MFS family permease
VRKQPAVRFIVLLGLVSLFSDVTYEGARSVAGPFLAVLGASATVVGVVAGAGELAGHALRLLSGYLADRTRGYWAFTILGYAVNLAAVPLLALAGRWETAVVLLLLERTGKAIRTPARDTMLSHASSTVGRGWGFGLHEAMDQIGALAGPLVVAAILAARGSYHSTFAALAVPALVALATLLVAQKTYPHPQELEISERRLETRRLPRTFWLYMVAAGFMAAGFADFSLVAYHLKRAAIASDTWIPILYALAMGVDAIAALIFGRLFDRIGTTVQILAAVFGSLATPLAFLGGFLAVLAGMVCWGAAMGIMESVLRAAVADMVTTDRRASAYGVFYAGYGLLWFLGSATLGGLYGWSITGLVLCSVALQLASIPIFVRVKRQMRNLTTGQH